MRELISKANTLLEALPYIQRFRSQTFVVKYGGSFMDSPDPEIRNGVAHNIKVGDVVVIPAGTGHLFTKIDDHITYLMVRIDPDKVTPLKDEAASKAYLSKPASR